LQTTEKIILGIDPGTIIMGYGIIKVKGEKIQLVEMDVLKMSSKLDVYQRLETIHKKVSQIIHKHRPQAFAIEAPFFGKNVQSMLKLGRAQGVAIAAAMQAGLSVHEYSPKKVKQSITGNGNASKEQVMKMLGHIMTLDDQPKYLDASDALSVAVCHHFQDKHPAGKSKDKVKGWEAFITQNPHRLKKT
jgi:crossover junction endodeoxyribonuclease RuvC